MAANKFATMLHKNTDRMTVVLVYSVLEWILIVLLLLNALFSYLIAKFASFFGLKTPCIFCSRVDHVFEPGKARRNAYRDLLCDAHAAEVSGLGYCSNHRNLVQASDMCEDCSSSRPSETTDRTLALLAWMKRSEEGEKDLRCSCCDVVLESGFYSPYLLLKTSSWDVLEYTHKGELAEEEEGSEDDEREEEEEEKQLQGDCDGEQEQEDFLDYDVCLKVREDVSLELLTVPRQEILSSDERVVPVEMIDATTLTKNHPNSFIPPRSDADGDFVDHTAPDIRTSLEEKIPLMSTEQIIDWKGTSPSLSAVNIVGEEFPSSVLLAGMSSGDCSSDHETVVPQVALTIAQKGVDVQVATEAVAEGFGELQASDVEAHCEISIRSEIRDQGHINRTHFDELSIPQSAGMKDQCPENHDNEATDKDQVKAESVNCMSACPELHEVEKERLLSDAPTYTEGIHALQMRFLLETWEFGTESLDGSVASEIDGTEMTADRLKHALIAERKSLSSLYAQLEEERSASEIATSQTMAMITRLQEEKAAMQMEALQYQRMMEEQSEYDQEALQLLNELMIKREKENRDLEKELEMYRKKVLAYEARERRKMLSNMSNGNGRTGTSSSSSSTDDSDDLSFELREGEECNYNHNESNLNTSTDAVLGSLADSEAAKHLITLDESLADFEEERLSILEQLKALEEKLFTLDDEDHRDNIKSNGHLSDENVQRFNGDYESSGNDVNSAAINGFKDDMDINDKTREPRGGMPWRGKRLLPLFDAVSTENEDGVISPKQEKSDGSNPSPEYVSRSRTDDYKKLAIAEEVDNVYERLQALEADREFLKHCLGSLKKGDKGTDLLQEILQHLRDLRSVEVRVRNASEALASLSA